MEDSFKQDITDRILASAKKAANKRSLHILRITVRGTGSAPVIEVILDGDHAVSVGDCEAVSKELQESIDAEKLVKGNFRLDVLSPGVEEPIVNDYQFTRNVGKLIEVHYEEGGESHTIHGRLRAITDQEIAMEPIHPNGKQSGAKQGTNHKMNGRQTSEDAAVVTEEDEQLYSDPVAMVKVDRSKVTKVLVQVEFSHK